MELVGYRLIEDATQSVVQEWGGSFNGAPGVPNPCTLPNGDHVCGWVPDTSVSGYTLASWYRTKDLLQAKAEAKSSISAAAEAERGKYITPGSGKAMSYQEVAEEAARYQATQGAGDYPFLQARVNSGRYQNISDAAAATLQIEAQWAVVGAAIDEVEDRAKLAVDAATTAEQVQAATVVTWP